MNICYKLLLPQNAPRCVRLERDETPIETYSIRMGLERPNIHSQMLNVENIYLTFMVNVGKYSIHGAFEIGFLGLKIHPDLASLDLP